jgi:hypothetical protein
MTLQPASVTGSQVWAATADPDRADAVRAAVAIAIILAANMTISQASFDLADARQAGVS